MLEQSKFAELDRHVNALQVRYEAGAAGDEELLAGVFAFGRAIPALEPQFDRWVEAFPNSYAARYSRGMYLMALGWALRGEGYSNETSAARFADFRRLLEKSEADYERSLQLTPKPVPTLTALIRSAIGQGNRALAEELYRKAIALDAKAMDPRRAYMWGLQPKWGGSVEALDAFLARAKADGLTPVHIRELEADYWTFMSDMADMAGDLDKALEHANRAVAVGNFASALIERGRIHHRRKEHARAIEDLTGAIEKSPDTGGRVYRLRGSAYEVAGRLAEAAADYRVAAERGDAGSQTRLGGAYNNGEFGFKKDYAEAFRWYRMAAALNDPWAQAYIAEMYYLGEGVKRSYPEAAKWAQASAEQKNPTGQTTLGIILWYGNGLPKDEDEAIRLWRMAAKKGEVAAQRNLQNLPSAWQRAKILMQDARDWVLPPLREQ